MEGYERRCLSLTVLLELLANEHISLPVKKFGPLSEKCGDGAQAILTMTMTMLVLSRWWLLPCMQWMSDAMTMHLAVNGPPSTVAISPRKRRTNVRKFDASLLL